MHMSVCEHVCVVLCVLRLTISNNYIKFQIFCLLTHVRHTYSTLLTGSHGHEKHLSNTVYSFFHTRCCVPIECVHVCVCMCVHVCVCASVRVPVCARAYTEKLLLVLVIILDSRLEAKRFCKQYFWFPNSPLVYS